MKIKLFIERLLNSLDNKKNNGFSARKLTAIVVMACFVIVHVSWLKHAFLREKYEYMIEVLIIDSSFVSLLLGIVTVAELIKLKGSNKNNDKDKRHDETGAKH